MVIKRLSLIDFRNYPGETVDFSPGVNLVIGDNAQGKTNLIEAVHLISIGRSVRTPRLHELVRFGKERSRVQVCAVKREGEYTIDMVLSGRDKRQVSINGLPVTRLSELMGVVTTVLFTPDEIGVIKASPRVRRRFLDIALCQGSSAYFYVLSQYNKVLAQRNRLLKSGRALGAALDVWDLQLVANGAKIILARRNYLQDLALHAAESHAYLTESREQLTLGYEGIAGTDERELSENFHKELRRTREKDTTLCFTHAGPQGDDFWVKADKIDLRRYGSQGQQRTAALSIKLAELSYLKAASGESPVLLLDDVFSELDEHRQEKLTSCIEGYQTIITLTDAQFQQFPGASIIRIQNGSRIDNI